MSHGERDPGASELPEWALAERERNAELAAERARRSGSGNVRSGDRQTSSSAAQEPCPADIVDALNAPWAQREQELNRRRAAREASSSDSASAHKHVDSMTESLKRIQKITGASAELERFVAFKDPQAARAQAQNHEHAEAAQREQLERALDEARAELGEWTPKSDERLQKLEQAANSEPDAKKLGNRGWALCRMAVTGSTHDLAYALTQMLFEVPREIAGCWVIEAMGLTVTGDCTRQLFATKARRKLARSYILWRCGRYGRLCDFAGSPSRRRVHGTVRCPQSLIARVCAIGGRPWSRATTTRDANEAHRAGLYRRVRLPTDVAPESERAGPSGQVVSRYVLELPRESRQQRARSCAALESVLANTGSLARSATLHWVQEVARHACRMATSALGQLQQRGLELACVPGLLEPRMTAPPIP